MEEFIKHIQAIKKKRKLDGKPIDFDTMSHIVSTVGGKYIAKGLMTSKELDSIKYQGCGIPYLGDDYIFWEDEEEIYKEADNMEDLKYITFDGDIKMAADYLGNYIEGTCINIKVGNKEFEVFMGDSESEKYSESYKGLGDNQYELVDVIFALKKLTKFLELSVDIGFSKSLVE